MVFSKGFWSNRFELPGVLGFAYGDHDAWYCNVEIVLHWARFPFQLCLVESGSIKGSSRVLSSDYCLIVARRAVPRVVPSVRDAWMMPPSARRHLLCWESAWICQTQGGSRTISYSPNFGLVSVAGIQPCLGRVSDWALLEMP